MKKLLLLSMIVITTSGFADSLDLGLIGITAHGADTTSQDWSEMKRKISHAADVVWNPEVNLTYEHDGWIANATYINDCAGFDAYFVGAGYRWHLTQTFHAEILAGPYFRKIYVENEDNGQMDGTKKVVEFLPWISLQKDFMFSKNFGAFVNLSSNYALTHAFTGIKVNF